MSTVVCSLFTNREFSKLFKNIKCQLRKFHFTKCPICFVSFSNKFLFWLMENVILPLLIYCSEFPFLAKNVSVRRHIVNIANLKHFVNDLLLHLSALWVQYNLIYHMLQIMTINYIKYIFIWNVRFNKG
jgi:hypothetical protein